MAIATAGFSSGTATIRHNAPVFAALFGQYAPEEVMFQARSMMGRWFGHHRKGLVAAQTVPGLRRAILSFGWAPWKVRPYSSARSAAQLRARIKGDKGFDIDDIEGRVVLRSEAEQVQEFGGTITPRARKLLAIPAGKYRRMRQSKRRQEIGLSPAEYNRKNPTRKLIPLRRRRKGNEVVILARPTGQTLKSGKPKLEAVFELRPSVRLEPRLKVRDTWARDESYRSRTLGEHVQNVTKQMNRFVSREGRRVG